MTRPGSVPITRLRFRGRSGSLNRLCRAFRERPAQSFTAADLAEFTELPFPDVRERLVETPELFIALPRKPNTNARYRLATSVQRMSEEETRAFIEEQSRSETWLAVGIVSAIVVVATVAGYLGVKY